MVVSGQSCLRREVRNRSPGRFLQAITQRSSPGSQGDVIAWPGSHFAEKAGLGDPCLCTLQLTYFRFDRRLVQLCWSLTGEFEDKTFIKKRELVSQANAINLSSVSYKRNTPHYQADPCTHYVVCSCVHTPISLCTLPKPPPLGYVVSELLIAAYSILSWQRYIFARDYALAHDQAQRKRGSWGLKQRGC